VLLVLVLVLLVVLRRRPAKHEGAAGRGRLAVAAGLGC
jgi:hypothetical protein